MARSIEMSAAGKSRWQAALAKLEIGTAGKLADKMMEGKVSIAEPTARKALKGEKIDRKTWESIFTVLELQRKEFFADEEWFDRTLGSEWEKLWDAARDGTQYFGFIHPTNLQHAGMGDDLASDDRGPYLSKVRQQEALLFEIPAQWQGHLVLLEMSKVSGSISLIAPSLLMEDEVLRGDDRRLLPANPLYPKKHIKLDTLGENQLWAGVFPESPQWEWLAEGRSKILELDVTKVSEVVDYVKELPPESRHLWKSSYQVVAA
jgi:hypothetical protein